MAANRREHTLLVVALTCLGLLVCKSFVFGPIYANWKTRSERVAELESLVSRGEMLIDQKDSIERRWRTMHEQSLPTDTSEAENKVISAVGQWAGDSERSF